MSNFITVKIDKWDALQMLSERVKRWVKNDDVAALYEQMYQNYIDGGCFDGCEFDVMAIVDNDCINYCRVIEESDGEEFEKIKAIYREQGLGDCSCECDFCNYIEAANYDKTLFLVR